MQVILTEDVVGLGDIGETVTVKPGYARNFLIPRGTAIELASASAKQVEHMSRRINAKKRQLKGAAEERAKEVSSLTLEFTLRGASGGKVFGSIGNRDIAAKLLEQGIEIDRRRVMIAEPIRSIGEHKVSVKLHPEVTANLTVVVNKAKATEEEEAQETEEARANLEASDEDVEVVEGFDIDEDGAIVAADDEDSDEKQDSES